MNNVYNFGTLIVSLSGFSHTSTIIFDWVDDDGARNNNECTGEWYV